MRLWHAALFALSVALVGAVLTAAQEHDASYPQTRAWQLGEVGANDLYPWARIDVFDTAGVCVYVARTMRSDGGTAIVAVPKTQLPKGAGCQ